nr:hypothetical protein [Tanacetum cinerariifolium]
MLKTRDYDLWSMRMEQYLTHTDYALWKVIINGDSFVSEPPAVSTVVPTKTEAQTLVRKNELKAKSTLLLAIPDEHLLKFHSIKDAKSHWEAIKIRCKHEVTKDLPPAWNNTALIMRNKPDVETLSMDDLYNHLKVYEAKIKGQSRLGSNSHNVAFVSSENTSSINEAVTVAHDIPAAGSKEQPSASSYADDVMFSLFVIQLNTPQLDNEDLKHINTNDLEEMDFKWQVAMITMRVKKFMKRTMRNLNFNGKEPVGFDKTKVKCYNCYRRGHFARECHAPRNQGNRSNDNERRVVPVETPANALVTQQIHQILSVSEIDEDNNQAKDRYKVRIGYHAVLPPYTRNYMPPRADLSFAGLDDYVFKVKISETRISVNENESISSKSSEEIREEPKIIRSSTPIIEDWESDSEDECEDKTSSEQEISRIFDSGCSRHMTGNKSFLTEYQEIDDGFVAFGGSPKRGIVIPTARVFCSCCQFFISAGVLFLLLEYSVPAVRSSLLFAKSMTTDNDGNLKIRPPITAEEHQQVQREEKARTILLSALPDEHMGDFYHIIDAKDI